MSKCDFNKAAKSFVAWLHGCSPVNLLQIFRTPFPKNTSGSLLLRFIHLPLTYFELMFSFYIP